ncbi:U3 small nucleolar RNA-associated protein 25 homolog [Nematostella vectensis]|uniref:U3 small nucleolar RNA-associated protein 25 homolog n=1 Tax=Nematostella vectensis TaxID=45351 RepID=UPI0020777C20|nr:U3 small nucleolar RNA-associated protein 25 homolog [Nematostella vectensis]
MAKHPKAKHKKNTKSKSKSKVKKLVSVNAKSLSRAQKRHLRDFGELHPANLSDASEPKTKRVKKVKDTEVDASNKGDVDQSVVGVEDDFSDDDVSPYQQLVGSLHTQSFGRHDDDDDDNVDDDDDDGKEEDSDQNEELEEQGAYRPSMVDLDGEVAKTQRHKHNDNSKDNGKIVSDDDNGNDDDEDSNDEDENGIVDHERNIMPHSDEGIPDEDYRLQDDDDDDDDDDADDDVNDKRHDNKQTRHPDPFSVHYEQDLDDVIQAKLDSKDAFERVTLMDGEVGKMMICKPVLEVPLVEVPKMKNLSLSHHKVKAKLIKTWDNLYNASGKASLSALQSNLFNYINSYQDLFYHHRTFENAEEIRRLYCLHAVNHILKTRSRVLKSNAKIVQAQKEERKPEEYRDQGLTRPKVLILVPFRDAALRVVELIIKLLLPDGEGQVMNKKRFYDEYTEEEDHKDTKRSHQPDDFKFMFAGNIDDCFRVGVSVMRKAVKLYSEFYSSDIIIASPLGLRTIIGSEGDKSRDFDFLSSLEVVVLDQADVFLMQNWEHVQHVFDHLHLQPKAAHDVDFSRVRNWCLNGWSKYYRQTLVISSFPSPELNSLFNSYCHNFAGKGRTCPKDVSGTISQVVTQVPQVFHRITCQSIGESPDTRFSTFINEILPDFQGPMMGHTAIFVPSYFDFVRLRNHFRRNEIPFAQISEYTKRGDVTRARTRFFDGSRPFLLYTERFYFFYRYRLRGIKNIIFYELPHYAHFYPEILNFLDTGSNNQSASSSPITCTILYTKYDSHRLSGIVGPQRCQHMMSSKKSVHMFITGDKTNDNNCNVDDKTVM